MPTSYPSRSRQRLCAVLVWAPAQRLQAGAGLADFKDSYGKDHFHQNWWWYRTNLDDREFALTNQIDARARDQEATLQYEEPAGHLAKALAIQLDYKLTRILTEGPDHARSLPAWSGSKT